jgi:hypothetical protein
MRCFSLPMTNSESSSKRLLAYGSLACGATALVSGNAEAATVVDVNATSYNTGLSDIGTVGTTFNPSAPFGPKAYLTFTAGSGVSAQQNGSYNIFSRSTDSSSPMGFQTSSSFLYSLNNGPSNGALLNSNDNWLFAKGVNDPNQQLWLQLQFGATTGSGFSIVRAVIPSTPGELPTAAAASAAVPETSSLALLSLGAAGLLKRRRRAA